MAAGWYGVDHAERHAFADEPIGRWRPIDPARTFHRLLDHRETLIETVAAINYIGFLGRCGDHRVAGAYDVAPAKFDSAHADTVRQVIHGGFDGKVGLRQSVAAKS